MPTPASPPFAASTNGYGAILFDLDGTLIDSLPGLTRSLNAILREDARRILDDDEVRLMVGDGIKVLVARAYAATGLPPENDGALNALVNRFSAHYDPDPSIGCALFAHAPEVLAGLLGMGFRLGVVTNKLIGPALTILRDFTLMPVLDVVVGGDTTPNLKPHPEPFLHAADQLELSPQRVVVVGDSFNDIEGGRRAGMRTIAVSYGYTRMPVSEFEADVVIDSLLDLPRAVMNLPNVAEIAT